LRLGSSRFYLAGTQYGKSLIILRTPISGVSEVALERFASRARKAARLEGELAILITGNDEIRELNHRFRRKNKATDVLSFPSAMPGVAGDIAISAEIARDNGEQFAHGMLTELKILMVHGMLHLAGYDHEQDEGEMARKERRLRQQLGLQEGLIERSTNTRPAATPRKSAANSVAKKPIASKTAGRKPTRSAKERKR
jgi:probable rRNA maturation factor